MIRTATLLIAGFIGVSACSPAQTPGGAQFLATEAAALTRLCLNGGQEADLRSRGYSRPPGFSSTALAKSPDGTGMGNIFRIDASNGSPCFMSVNANNGQAVLNAVSRTLASDGYVEQADDVWTNGSRAVNLNGSVNRNIGAGINIATVILSTPS